ncbi:MAG: hypothetical protein AB8G77_08095 [Rhodothermales bacterium]
MMAGIQSINTSSKRLKQQQPPSMHHNGLIKGINHMLDKIEKLREGGVQVFKNSVLGVLGEYKRVFLQPRYMKKFAFFDENALVSKYINENQEKIDELLPVFTHRGDKGTDNSFGWMVQGFIEAKDGHLRLQTREEHLQCMGCHTTLGTTIDNTFAFGRKVTGAKGWGYINTKNMPDAPNENSELGIGEIEHYLRVVGGGDEFRENAEMKAKYFNADGTLNTEAIRAADVYELISPSPRRALDLNKAYMTIVKDQDFIHGRDANLKPANNVYRRIDEDVPVLPQEKTQQWDIRLNWE